VPSLTKSTTIEKTKYIGMRTIILTLFFLPPSLASSNWILDPYDVSPKFREKLESDAIAIWSKESEGSENFWQDVTLGMGCNEEVAYIGFVCEVGDDCTAVEEEPGGSRLLYSMIICCRRRFSVFRSSNVFNLLSVNFHDIVVILVDPRRCILTKKRCRCGENALGSRCVLTCFVGI
jgi:hypothetical protein